MKGMTISRMAQACGAQVYEAQTDGVWRMLSADMVCKRFSDSEKEAVSIVTDSRQAEPNGVFVALSGARVDGHDFISQVLAAGALAVICERVPEHGQQAGICLCVPSARDALRKLAAYYLEVLALPVVGITGSVGKTSTKEMIASVLAQKYCVHKTAGNFNNEIGLPLTVFGLRKEHEVAVLEMGISDFGEMRRLAQIAKPDVAVITNIGTCHLENLGTRDGVLRAKTEVFSYVKADGAVILNGDDDKLCTVGQVNGKAPVFYGIGADAAGQTKTVYAQKVENHGLRGIDFDLHMPEGVRRVHVAIPGEHNVSNALAAAAVGRALGLSLDEICAGIAAARTISGRTNMIEANDYLVIDDCYNANPVSMRAALDVLSQGQGRRIAVLGDMGELGENECQLHYEVGVYAAKKELECVFTAGELSKELARGVRDHAKQTQVYAYETREELEAALLKCVQPDDTILVKASHFMDYSKIVQALTNKK